MSRRPSRGVWVVGAHPSFFGVARIAETIVGRIIIRVVGRKKGMLGSALSKGSNKIYVQVRMLYMWEGYITATRPEVTHTSAARPSRLGPAHTRVSGALTR